MAVGPLVWLLWVTAIMVAAAVLLHLVPANWLKPLLYVRVHPQKRTILVAGLRRSGKTRLFQQLTRSPALAELKPTVASLQVQTGCFVPSTEGSLTQLECMALYGDVEVRDLPGDDYMDERVVEAEMGNAHALVFTVDCTDKTAVVDAANLLFALLATSGWQRRRQPLCVVLTKLDATGARHKNLVREDLERNIERSRRLQTQRVEAVKIPAQLSGWHCLLPPRLRSLLPTQRPGTPAVPATLVREPCTLFRFAAVDAPIVHVVQENDPDLNAELVRRFVQRAVLKGSH